MNKPLVTILTAPKPFVDSHMRIIQRNALRSWLALGDQAQVIVLGDDEGIKQNCDDLGIMHIPGVRCNDKGTPLLSSMLEMAREKSTTPYLAIVNADIILFRDFLQAIKFVGARKEKFLLVGQRWDIQIANELQNVIDFKELKAQIQSSASLHPPAGSDYFVFPRDCYRAIPDFAIGRAGWDNWFIFKSRFERWDVIDGTQLVSIVHQNHDYSHLPGGQPHYRLPETKQNVALGGGEHTIFTLFDAQFQLEKGGIFRKKFTLKKVMRELEILPLSVFHSMAVGKWFFFLFHPHKGYAAFKTAIRRLLIKKQV